MRSAGYAIIAIMLAFSLFAPGCTGANGGSANVLPENLSVNDSGAAPAENQAAAAQAGENGTDSSVVPHVGPKPGAQPAPYVNYCYPTYWKGRLSGFGHNNLSIERCGEYNYSMEISVIFTMPFDLAAYLRGEDFNFLDCPGISEAAQNGSGDISIDGNFRSERKITSNVSGIVDRNPDAISTSSGAFYVSQPYGRLAIATFPRASAQAARDGKATYPHLVASRCTWENGLHVTGIDEAALYGADWEGFALSQDNRTIYGRWGINNTDVGNYTLSRTN
ncbi:MAG: hypothetical protein NTX79_02195 [Candidatus Micrarchaeota archaeon]|nr:hypothetical protein [Candidatus Micrarchaeota archaeon]